MGFLKKLLCIEDDNSYTSDNIESFGQIYCPDKTYPDDNIDLKKVKDLYALGVVFDGVNVDSDILTLKYSFLLNDENDYIWGVASINESFSIKFKNDKSFELSTKDNISMKQIFITDVCPLTMTSMFYKSGNYFCFYARSTNGIYFRIFMEPKHYILMEYMRSLLLSKQKLTSISAAPVIRLGDIDISHSLSFCKEITKDDITGITYLGDKVLILVKAADSINLVCYCSLKGVDQKTINKFKSTSLYIEDLNMHINYLRTKEDVFMLRNKIDCGYIIDGKKNIVTNYVFFEDCNKILREGEKRTTKAIRIYPPAYDNLCKKLLEFIHEDILKK